MVSWDEIDTVLLDMDGTLLDLSYDNHLWNTLLPVRYSETHQLTLESAREQLFARMSESKGQLHFYCLDYWAEYTGLDVIALHHEAADLISYRPYASEFLEWLNASSKRSLLITNAHRDSLEVKDRYSNLTEKLDVSISCHDYGAPKESQDFWHALMEDQPFEPERTLFIDDNESVLHAAARYGIGHLLSVAQPDSARPPRVESSFRALVDFRDLFPGVSSEDTGSS